MHSTMQHHDSVPARAPLSDGPAISRGAGTPVALMSACMQAQGLGAHMQQHKDLEA